MSLTAISSARLWIPIAMALGTVALLLLELRPAALGLGLLIPPVAVLGLSRCRSER